jgi:hypothetical protein
MLFRTVSKLIVSDDNFSVFKPATMHIRSYPRVKINSTVTHVMASIINSAVFSFPVDFIKYLCLTGIEALLCQH